MENLTRGKIYMIDVGKGKSYINIFKYEEEEGDPTMEKSNGKYRESNKNPLTIDL